jgi:hypothetical protein
MRSIIAGVFCALVGFAAQADDRPILIELFTSQGCSSCPPSDALLKELTKRSDVLPLALHVDYWDYLGWKDNFGAAAYTKRQRAYAKAANSRTIYTPQMIIQGTDHVVGYKPDQMARYIRAQRSQPELVELTLRRTESGVSIIAKPTGSRVGATVVQLIRYIPEQTVKIKRGENAGKSISYVNIVREWTVIGSWNGRGMFSTHKKITGPDPVVVIVQSTKGGPVLAARRLR